MPRQVFLVPLVGGPNDRVTLATGFKLGKAMEAHLEVCFVRPDPDDAFLYLGPDSGGQEALREEFRREIEETGKKASAKARRQFYAACKKYGVPGVGHPKGQDNVSAHWIEVVGSVADEVPEAAKLADVTIFVGPLTDHHLFAPSVLERTLVESGRPLLLMPEESGKTSLDHVAIAWDGDIQAVRAVFAAREFLQNAKSIHIITVRGRYDETPDPKKLIDYLAWGGLNAQSNIVDYNDRNIGQVLLSAAVDIDADLLIMGGFAHARSREVIFGGATMYAIRKTRLPILMMH